MPTLKLNFAIGAMCIVCAFAIHAGAQEASGAHASTMAFQDHFNNAKLLAAGDLAGRNLLDCSTPPVSAAPTGTPIVAPPTKVFDQLYYLGTNSVASWALVTS